MLQLGLLASCLVGCASPAAKMSPPDGPPARTFDVDIAVSADHVMVYTGGNDLDCTCTGFDPFPPAGACGALSDGVACQCDPPATHVTSCITDIRVEQAGATVATASASVGATAVLVDGTQANLTLVIEGCGQATSRIPISGDALPLPTITTSSVGGDAGVAWTSDLPSSDALVAITNGTFGAQCHAAGTMQQTFQLPASATRFASVQPFGAPATYDVPLGHVTVWRGGIGEVQFMP